MKIASIEVSFVDKMGTDLTVVNAARVSFDKESEWERHEITGEDSHGRYTEQINRLSDRDRALIGYLAKHGHWSPFAHTSVQLRIKAPIFVARQLVKHQVGLVWNEVSRRYVDSEPEFYFPDVWRGKPVNAKQGSDGVVTAFRETVGWEKDEQGEPVANAFEFHSGEGHYTLSDYVKWQCRDALLVYNDLLESGVAPEQARIVLPQNTMTEWWWTGSLMAFARVCKQRLDAHAQQETQEVAKQINTICDNLFPVSWDALMEGNT